MGQVAYNIIQVQVQVPLPYNQVDVQVAYVNVISKKSEFWNYYIIKNKNPIVLYQLVSRLLSLVVASNSPVTEIVQKCNED